MKRPSISGMWQEFKAFAFKGNMIELAVAVVIGGAFGKVVTALVNDIIMPLVAYFVDVVTYVTAKVVPTSQPTTQTSTQDPLAALGFQSWHVGHFPIGDLLSEGLNFFMVAFAVFIFMVKLVGAVMKKPTPPPAPSEPTSKECPFCLSVIPIKAKKCAHCTADLPV
jgi:large conductance mechanosensitive channel